VCSVIFEVLGGGTGRLRNGEGDEGGWLDLEHGRPMATTGQQPAPCVRGVQYLGTCTHQVAVQGEGLALQGVSLQR
jgi:hypothetical protein